MLLEPPSPSPSSPSLLGSVPSSAYFMGVGGIFAVTPIFTYQILSACVRFILHLACDIATPLLIWSVCGNSQHQHCCPVHFLFLGQIEFQGVITYLIQVLMARPRISPNLCVYLSLTNWVGLPIALDQCFQSTPQGPIVGPYFGSLWVPCTVCESLRSGLGNAAPGRPITGLKIQAQPKMNNGKVCNEAVLPRVLNASLTVFLLTFCLCRGLWHCCPWKD